MFDLLELERLLTTEMTPEYREQLAVVETYLDKLQKGFSFSFLDSFWSEAVSYTHLTLPTKLEV